MVTLEIDINCMCCFVPDPLEGNKGLVHVLMPKTTLAHQKEHVVRLFHRSFYRDPTGLPMEGWALELGTGDTANTLLKPEHPELEQGTIINMTHVTEGKMVDRALVDEKGHDHVLSRVTFRAGRMWRISAEKTKWTVKDTDYILAHQVVWRIDDVAEELVWKPVGAEINPPLESLTTLPPDDFVNGKKVYRLSIHHVTEKALPPNTSGLSNAAIQSHFREFFKLLGVDKPDIKHLPKLSRNNQDLEGHGTYACKEIQAVLKPRT